MIEDDYPTCQETYATLRVYHDTADPNDVSSALGLTPSSTQRVGEQFERRGIIRTYRLAGWFYGSKSAVESYDSQKHLHWLCDRLEPLDQQLRALRAAGWRMDIACFWDSSPGHGGPTLSPALLRRLAALEIELWFDVYFIGAYQEIWAAKQATETRPNA